jgi:hypothetical protein
MELEQPAAADSIQTTAAPNTDSNPAPETPSDPSATPVDENAELLGLLPADDGMEEIEYEGEKAKVPPKFREAFLRHQDYTQKTQTLAEEKRAHEAQVTQHKEWSQFIQQNLNDVAKMVAIDEQLAEFQKLDWNTLIAQNPQQAQMLDRQARELQDKKVQLAQELAHKQQKQTLEAQQATARRSQDSQQELTRDIKGWSLELANKIADHSRKTGVPAEYLSANTPAWMVKTLHKAMQWDNLIAQRSAKPAPAPAKPATKVTGTSSPATVDPDKMSGDEYMKWRNAQLAKRKKR